jgi:hypothetical protein
MNRKVVSRAAVNRALEWYKENTEIDDKGALKSEMTILHDAAFEVLVQFIAVDEEIAEETYRRIAKRAVFRWRRYKKYQRDSNMPAAFLHAVEVAQRKVLQKQRLFRVLMFLNVDCRPIQHLNPITILGDQISIKTWNDLSDLDTGDFWKRVLQVHRRRSRTLLLQGDRGKPIPKTMTFEPVLFEVEACGPEAAESIAEDRLKVFRSILNSSQLIGRFTYFRSEPKPLSKVLPSPFYGIFDALGNYVTMYYTVEGFHYSKTKLKEKQLEKIEYLLPIFAQDLRYPSTLYHVLRLLRLYQEALDILAPQHAYLAMWQVLESAVTFPGERISHSVIIRRVSCLLQIDPSSLFKDVLKLVTRLRHDYVHSGEFLDRSDSIFFLLKLFVDECIRRLLTLADDFPTIHDLEEYFVNVSLGDAVLERRKKAVSTIQKYRED